MFMKISNTPFCFGTGGAFVANSYLPKINNMNSKKNV